MYLRRSAEPGRVRNMHWWPKVQVSGTGLTLVATLAPTLGFPIPYWVRLIGVVIGCLMLAWPACTAVWAEAVRRQKRLALIGIIVGLATIGCAYLYFGRQPMNKSPATKSPSVATIASQPRSTQQPPANLLLSIFMTDYNHRTGAFTNANVAIINQYNKPVGKIYFRINYDKGSHSKFMLIYIPASSDTTKLALLTVSLIKSLFDFEETHNPIGGFQEQMQGESNPEKFTDYPFSGQVYIYHESPVGAEDKGAITKVFKDNRMSVQLMGRGDVLGVWANIQLGIVKPLPTFELTDIGVCLKGPLTEPRPIPAPLCTPEKK